jgi:uncharacterized alpha-E superfamily protein
MLSRVADSLYWMSRYLERAEHSARLVDVELQLWLDQSRDAGAGRWRFLMESLQAPSVPGPLDRLQPLERVFHRFLHRSRARKSSPGARTVQL